MNESNWVCVDEKLPTEKKLVWISEREENGWSKTGVGYVLGGEWTEIDMNDATVTRPASPFVWLEIDTGEEEQESAASRANQERDVTESVH